MPPSFHLRHAAAAALCAALGGCAAPAATSAWPASAGHVALEDWREDGGDSVEPAAGAIAVVALEASESSKDKVAVAVTAPSPTGDAVVAPDAIKPPVDAPPPGPDASEFLMGEEIIIIE